MSGAYGPYRGWRVQGLVCKVNIAKGPTITPCHRGVGVKTPAIDGRIFQRNHGVSYMFDF
jgi:hypothetical protein